MHRFSCVLAANSQGKESLMRKRYFLLIGIVLALLVAMPVASSPSGASALQEELLMPVVFTPILGLASTDLPSATEFLPALIAYPGSPGMLAGLMRGVEMLPSSSSSIAKDMRLSTGRRARMIAYARDQPFG